MAYLPHVNTSISWNQWNYMRILRERAQKVVSLAFLEERPENGVAFLKKRPKMVSRAFLKERPENCVQKLFCSRFLKTAPKMASKNGVALVSWSPENGVQKWCRFRFLKNAPKMASLFSNNAPKIAFKNGVAHVSWRTPRKRRSVSWRMRPKMLSRFLKNAPKK